MASAILAVVGDDQADLEQVAAIVEKHPELTTRILRCANSAYYGHRGKIQSVAEAIIRVLGLSMTKALSLALTLESSFRPVHCPGFKEEQYWYSAVLAAHLARGLAPLHKGTPPSNPGAAYTAGLIHNIGARALVALFPEVMEKVFAAPDEAVGRALILETFGVDAQQAGALLARRWGLPEPLVRAVALCREPASMLAEQPLAELVSVAVALAEGMIQGRENPERSVPLAVRWSGEADVAMVVARIAERTEELRMMAQLLVGQRG
jgi:HD-like signal output (HDOD) protein